MSLYSRRVNAVEPVVEEWSFAVEYCTEEPPPKPPPTSRARRNLQLVESKGPAGRAGVGCVSGKESLTVFAPEVLNVNVMEAQISRYFAKIWHCPQVYVHRSQLECISAYAACFNVRVSDPFRLRSLSRTVAAWSADMALSTDTPSSPQAAGPEERTAAAAAAAAAAGERSCVRVRNRCGLPLVARDFHSRTCSVTVSPNLTELLLIDKARGAAAFGPNFVLDDDGGAASERSRLAWPRSDKSRMLHVSLGGIGTPSGASAAGFVVPLDSSGARVHQAPGGGEVVATVGMEDGTALRGAIVTVRARTF